MRSTSRSTARELRRRVTEHGGREVARCTCRQGRGAASLCVTLAARWSTWCSTSPRLADVRRVQTLEGDGPTSGGRPPGRLPAGVCVVSDVPDIVHTSNYCV